MLSSADTARILGQSLVFSSLNNVELSALAQLALSSSFKTDEFIFWDGDPPERLYVVADGRVRVLKHSTTGKEFVIAYFGSGEMFGEVAVFENKPYPASAQAAAATKVISIKRQDFLSFLAGRPQVALSIISVLAGRLRDAQSRLRDLAVARVEQRLASVLLMLSSKLGPTLPFTRQEIADMSGTTTETAIRVMSQLKERGIISSTRGKVTIRHQEKLRLLSEGPPEI